MRPVHRESSERQNYIIQQFYFEEKRKEEENLKLQKETSNGLSTDFSVCLEFMNHAPEMIQVMAGHFVL